MNMADQREDRTYSYMASAAPHQVGDAIRLAAQPS